MKTCPICGSQMSLKASFQGRKGYRNKRTTYVCTCGYSTIKETRREEAVRNGKI